MKYLLMEFCTYFNKNFKYILSGSTIVFLTLLSFYLYNPEIVNKITNDIDYRKLIIIFGLMFSIFSLIMLLLNIFLNYLDNKSSNIDHLYYFDHKIEKLLNNKIHSNSNITENEKKQLIERLTTQFENNISDEFKQKIEERIKIKNLQKYSDRSIFRLQEEINSLNRRGNINLFIGMLLSLSGLLYLGFTVYSSASYNSYESLITHLTPRTLFVIFIELFSFFFLNLYKKSLDDIKYYQNEITNLEAKYLALDLAKQSNNFKLISNSLDVFLKTERNFVIKKDETTIELEKNRIEAQSSNSTVQALKDIINFKR